MEEGKIKKKKNSLSIPVFNGGGIAGVLVLGGALATAALIAFFARRTPKKKGQSKDSGLKNINDLSDEENEDFIQCFESSGRSDVDSDQISEKELISTQNSELEVFSELEISGLKDTLTNGSEDDESFLPEIINPEIISLCKDINIDTEELKLLVNKIHDAEEDTEELKLLVNKIPDAEEEPPLLEAIEELKKEIEVFRIVLVEQVEENVINDEARIEEGTFSERVIEDVEENQLLVSEEEDSDDDDDDEEEEVDEEEEEEVDEEESEKSSIETGDSSMESNAEPIWSTESIEKLSIAIKEMNLDYQDSGEKDIEEDGTIEKDSIGYEDESIKESIEISDNKEDTELLTVNYQPVRSGDMRVLILSILGTVLVLLMLGFATEHKAMFSYLVKGDSV